MRFLTYSFALLYSLAPGLSHCDELNLEKKAAIKELMQVSGAAQMGQMFGSVIIQQSIQVLKQSRPDIDPKAFDIIKAEANELLYEELKEKESLLPYIYPIYHKYFTIDDIRGLTEFYKTPLGQKAITVMPKLSQDSMEAGQEWVQSTLPKFQQRVSDRFKQEGIAMDK